METTKPKRVKGTGIVVRAEEVVVQKQPQAVRDLVLEGDPEAQLAYATKAANALMKVVRPRMISGRKYLEFGAWQTLGRFFGSTVAVESTKKLVNEKNELLGYEARAIVYQHGEIISSAEAMCMAVERNWKGRDEFALRSMAQTRASAKALRNAYGWVAELAGFASTPAEEMGGEQDNGHSNIEPPKQVQPKSDKSKIVFLLKELGKSTSTKEAVEKEVKQLAGIDLTEANLPEIVTRLEIIVKERHESPEIL